MDEQTKQPTSQAPAPAPAATATIAKAEIRAPRRSAPSRPGSGGGRPGSGPPRRGGGGRRPSEPKEFEQKILDLSRVTRVTAGGKRMSFRAALVVGDKKGRVGLGVAKGADVQLSLEKAYRQGKKNMVRVPLEDETIPHAVEMKFGSAVVLIKPAPKGTGLKCGGAVRMVLELAGVPNAVSKVLRSSNKINIAQATLDAIRALRPSKRRETPSNVAKAVKS